MTTTREVDMKATRVITFELVNSRTGNGLVKNDNNPNRDCACPRRTATQTREPSNPIDWNYSILPSIRTPYPSLASPYTDYSSAYTPTAAE